MGAVMKKIYLSDTDKKIAGICGGIGEAFDIDSTIIRLVTVFFCVATAVLPLAVTYIVGWFIIPKKPSA